VFRDKVLVEVGSLQGNVNSGYHGIKGGCMATQIARKGQAVTVEIPEDLLRKANLSVGDAVEWTLTPAGSLTLRSSRHVKAEKPADGYDDWKQQEIQAGFSEIEAGESVPNEKVIEWLRSWGSKNELPPPL
jgi:antitoxin component of MazEF toxin-antitoxin module